MAPLSKPVHGIYKDQPYVVILDHTRRRSDTGLPEPATGILDMFTWLEYQGVEIAGTRVASAELAVLGRYKGEITAAMINAALFGAISFDKQRVRVVQGNTAQDVLGSFEVPVKAVRDV